MANGNFIVQNGLTVGAVTIFAGNGDIITRGNLTSAQARASFDSINNTPIGNSAPSPQPTAVPLSLTLPLPKTLQLRLQL